MQASKLHPYQYQLPINKSSRPQTRSQFPFLGGRRSKVLVTFFYLNLFLTSLFHVYIMYIPHLKYCHFQKPQILNYLHRLYQLNILNQKSQMSSNSNLLEQHVCTQEVGFQIRNPHSDSLFSVTQLAQHESDLQLLNQFLSSGVLLPDICTASELHILKGFINRSFLTPYSSTLFCFLPFSYLLYSFQFWGDSAQG